MEKGNPIKNLHCGYRQNDMDFKSRSLEIVFGIIILSIKYIIQIDVLRGKLAERGNWRKRETAEGEYIDRCINAINLYKENTKTVGKFNISIDHVDCVLMKIKLYPEE